MFGFSGKPQVEFRNEANGEVSPGRDFNFIIGSKRAGTRERAIFDFDNEGADPQQQMLLTATPETYDGIENKLTPSIILPASDMNVVTGYTMLGAWPTTNQLRGWRFSATTALSPVTRKYRALISNPEFIEVIGLQYLNNNNGNGAATNTGVGTVVVNANGFKNLTGLVLYETRLTGLTLKPTTLLRDVWIIECPTLTTLTGKLPASTKNIMFGDCPVTSIAAFIADAVNVVSFFTGRCVGALAPVNHLATLTGTLDVSHMTQLKEFCLWQNASLAALVLPSGKSDWRFVLIAAQSAASSASIPTARFEEMLASPTLQVFDVHQNGKAWTRTFGNSDFSGVLLFFYIYSNTFVGNITLSTAKPAIREFKAGNQGTHTGIHLNSHPVCDLTGLTGALQIDVSGCEVADLQLPVNTVCQFLFLLDNKLDIATNPNLITQVNAMTALNWCYFSSANQVNGQTSTNGLGADGVLSGLVNATQLLASNCKMTGTWVLPNVNKLQGLNVNDNAGLVSLTNFSVHTGLQNLICYNCPALVISIPSTFTALGILAASNSGITSVNLTGKTAGNISLLYVNSSPNLTSIVFPAAGNTVQVQAEGGNGLTMNSCPLLTSVTNLEHITYFSATGTRGTSLKANDCALNQTFPIGQNNFIPRTIELQNNLMTRANVDATIDSLYTNRAKWSVYSAAKTLNIGGNNEPPTGIYQAPTGFVLSSNDGTPATAKEKLYVLVNNYAWTVTYQTLLIFENFTTTGVMPNTGYWVGNPAAPAGWTKEFTAGTQMKSVNLGTTANTFIPLTSRLLLPNTMYMACQIDIRYNTLPAATVIDNDARHFTLDLRNVEQDKCYIVNRGGASVGVVGKVRRDSTATNLLFTGIVLAAENNWNSLKIEWIPATLTWNLYYHNGTNWVVMGTYTYSSITLAGQQMQLLVGAYLQTTPESYQIEVENVYVKDTPYTTRYPT